MTTSPRATEAGGVGNGTPGVDPTGNVLTNDTDVDGVANGETATVTTTGALAGAHGTLTLNADGSYSLRGRQQRRRGAGVAHRQRRP